MQIAEKLENLYKKWQKDNDYSEQFIGGGVVNEKLYEESKPKLLFLLKEANDPDRKESWNLDGFLHSEIDKNHLYTMWRAVGTWVYGFYNDFPPHTEIYSEDMSNLFEGLRRISAVNIKKTGGGGSSDWDELVEHTKKNKYLLLEEIKIINPDIIICGGTFWIIEKVFNDFKVEESKCGVHYAVYNEKVFLDFVHPAYQVKHAMMYSYFKDCMKDVLEIQNSRIKS